jgi:signal transduction histidine kinase
MPSDARTVGRYALPAFISVLIVSGLYASSRYSYLLFHSLVELFCIVTAFVIFILAWHTRRIQDNQYLLFVGIALLGTAAIELVHALAYKGMGIFAGHSADLPTQLWIAFRYLFSISLLIAPLFIKRRFRAWSMLALFSGITIALLISIFSNLFPACFSEGSGLTTFKTASEYIISLVFLAGLAFLHRERQSFDRTVFYLMTASIAASIASELSFTQYASVFGPANMIGHFFLLASMLFIYRAIVITGVVDPSNLLFRNLKMSEAALLQAHDELKNSKAEITAMIENVPIIMLLVDRERRVRKANVAASRFANRSQEDMLGRRGGEAIRCLHSLDVPEGCGFGPSCGTCAVHRTILDTFASGANRQGVEARVSFDHRGRREEMVFLVSTSLLTLSDEQLNLVCIEDITVRKQAEEALQKAHDELDSRVKVRTAELARTNEELETEIAERLRAEAAVRTLNRDLEQRVAERTAQLEAANKELESFAFSVSHDLRAPLRAIDGFTQAIEDEQAHKLDDSGKNYLGRVRAAAAKMAQLIDALLDLSRQARGELKCVSVDLSSFAKEIAGDLQRTQPLRKTEFIIADNITAQGDAAMLRAVIGNLLENAWKFTGKRIDARIEFGMLDCGSRNEEFEIVYFVKDSGAGFDQAYAGKLFTAFQRLHTVEDFPGLGIGLTTVQRIIHRHGGRIWAEGEPGKGATFYFTL